MLASDPKKRYKKKRVIGRGGYGKIYEIEDLLNNRTYALKKMLIDEERGVEFTTIREISILRQLNHPGIIKIREVWVEKGRKLCVKMDYFDTDLSRLLDAKKFETTQADTQFIMYHVLSSVAHLHANFLLHRDIKPPNYVVNKEGEIVLIDFGLSRKFGSPGRPLTKNVITRWYKPPEILFGARFYSEKVDVWSCGCIFAECFLGEPLFAGGSDIDMLSKIFGIRGTPSASNWPDAVKLPNYFPFQERKELPLSNLLVNASPEAVALIDSMLQLDPNRRPSIAEVLESPFFEDKESYKPQFAAKVKAFLQSPGN